MKANTRTAKVTAVLIHNPAQPATWPGERTRNMTKKKTGGKNRNSASVKQSRPAANLKAKPKQNPVKSQKKKTGGRKRNGSWLPNFGTVGGVTPMTVLGAGGGLFAGEAAASLLPKSITGDLLLLGGAFGAAMLLNRFRLTKPIAGGVGIGVGAVAVKNGLNRLSNGAVGNFFSGATQRVSGYLQPAPQQVPAAGDNANAGMSGFYPRRVAQVW
jgi:hypothetical protein